ncbi:glucuronate isomerase [Abyssalbus ytuae]|uniref:Uronate isomerase n=1 Tax=Abyssalbus ytuae TaxID=2926907 RepID=A0A9E7D2Q2_9FLAO|nr:glucuronate isomerase [Abyssalbus ytuae]UOB18398.1 glucuronate isomerase [Abyssalbus ytuae]
MKIKPFLGDQFLLENSVAEELYHNYAKKQPVIDYHSHISDEDVYSDRQFESITRVWLESDHSKWRAMRTYGINEKFITGNTDDYQKFEKWAQTVPYTLRNPLFQWTQLELKRFFSIEKLLNKENAKEIYAETKEKLQLPELSSRGILKKMNVEIAVTTDDPVSELVNHKNISKQKCGFKLLPTFRPDKAVHIDKKDFRQYIQLLGQSANMPILDFSDLIEVLTSRIDYFHENGCRISDHGLEYCYTENLDYQVAEKALKRKMSGMDISTHEAVVYKSVLLFELGKMYADNNWVMQLHLGAMRNNNSRMFNILGHDAGYDSIGDFSQGKNLSVFLNRLDAEGKLPKTIIYNLNPKDNEVVASMAGNFNDGSVKGKVQFGAAWWFLDQKDGIEKQLNALSNIGMLSCFVGMLSDSRSLFSYSRHEYFRRILCNLIGKDVVNGELPNDIEFLGSVVNDISYHNARMYFDF